LSHLTFHPAIRCRGRIFGPKRDEVTGGWRKLHNSIQFNSILYYLCAVPTAARPITNTAQCKKKVISYWTKTT
jgi:hypothetical protein